jgi:AcrR family transcriptional regulator
MSSNRRVGAESSETRARIILAAEQVIRDEGYAAASTRRVAAVGGFKPSLVHYYFPSTDDLLLAVFERGAAQSDAMVDAALAGPDPVRALWRFFSDASRTAISVEFIALAIHRPAIRAQIAAHSETMRARQAQLIGNLLARRIEAEGGSAAGLSVILAGIGRALMMEAALGVTSGHDEARAWVDRWLSDLLAKD